MIRTVINYERGIYNHLLTYLNSNFIKTDDSIHNILIMGHSHNVLRENWTSNLYLGEYIRVCRMLGISNGIHFVVNDKGQCIHFLSEELGREAFQPYHFDLVINDGVKDEAILAEIECRLMNSKHNELITIEYK